VKRREDSPWPAAGECCKHYQEFNHFIISILIRQYISNYFTGAFKRAWTTLCESIVIKFLLKDPKFSIIAWNIKHVCLNESSYCLNSVILSFHWENFSFRFFHTLSALSIEILNDWRGDWVLDPRVQLKNIWVLILQNHRSVHKSRPRVQLIFIKTKN
jgi:hypothetical protein